VLRGDRQVVVTVVRHFGLHGQPLVQEGLLHENGLGSALDLFDALRPLLEQDVVNALAVVVLRGQELLLE